MTEVVKKKKKKKVTEETGTVVKKKKKKVVEDTVNTNKKADKMAFLNTLKKDKEKIKIKNKEREIDDVDFFVPTIKQDDNVLAREVKSILIEEKVNIKSLNWENDNEKNNFKGGLRNNSTMSVARFERWLELLGKDYTLTIFDK